MQMLMLSALALWGLRDDEKYQCLLLLKMPAGKKLPAGSEFELWSLIPPLLSYLCPFFLTKLYVSRQKDTFLSAVSPCQATVGS